MTPKDLRKQIRNEAQGMLTEALLTELADKVYARLLKDITIRMDMIANNARDTLNQIDTRTKDMVSYAVRNSAK